MKEQSVVESMFPSVLLGIFSTVIVVMWVYRWFTMMSLSEDSISNRRKGISDWYELERLGQLQWLGFYRMKETILAAGWWFLLCFSYYLKIVSMLYMLGFAAYLIAWTFISWICIKRYASSLVEKIKTTKK